MLQITVVITDQISNFLDTQKLGYVATVSSDFKPNVSPKGTIARWDSNTLVFADIRSPDTVANLRKNPHVEISAIDPLVRRGYLFVGVAKIVTSGDLFERGLDFYRNKGIKSPINSIIHVKVSNVMPVTSPLYDLGVSENEIKSKWQDNFSQR